MGCWGGEQRWVLGADLPPLSFFFFPRAHHKHCTEPGAAWGAVLLKTLPSLSIYGAPAECLASCCALWIESPGGTYSPGPGNLRERRAARQSTGCGEHPNTPDSGAWGGSGGKYTQDSTDICPVLDLKCAAAIVSGI